MRDKKWLMLLIFTIMPMVTLAFDAGEPCDDSDPLDNQCPLDSWVYMAILAVIVIVFVGIHLRKEAIKEYTKAKQQKAAARTT